MYVAYNREQTMQPIPNRHRFDPFLKEKQLTRRVSNLVSISAKTVFTKRSWQGLLESAFCSMRLNVTRVSNKILSNYALFDLYLATGHSIRNFSCKV